MKELFTRYYKYNEWGGAETPSGPGSSMEHTESIRKALPELFDKYDIRSILDAPCGDYHWFKEIDRYKQSFPLYYTGGDIVEAMIEENNKKYFDGITQFITIDITTDPLPEADLMLCRDCLIHFSDADIIKFLENFKRSKIKYLLTSNNGIGENKDVQTGQHRFLNLHAPPFNFGLPYEVISEWTWEGFPPKTLNLYERNAIK